MFKVMNKSEAILWGGAILSIIGIVGTGVSAYFVATRPKNDKNSTGKIVGLVLSILLSIVGVALLLYHFEGYKLEAAGTCPLEQYPQGVPDVVSDVVPVPAPAPVQAPVQAPIPSQGPVNFNISVNQPAVQKPV